MAPSTWNRAFADGGEGRWWLYLALAGSATMIVWVKAAWPLLLLQALLLTVTAALAAGGSLRFHLAAALPFTAIALWGTLQLAAGSTAEASATVEACLFWTALAALALICRWTGAGPGLLKRAAPFAGALIAIGLAQFFTSKGDIFWLWPSGNYEVFGPFQSRNNFASFVLLFLPYFLWRALERSHAPSALLAALSTGAIAGSGSRAGTALAIAEILTVLCLCRRNRVWTIRIAILTACVVAVSGWEILGRKIFDRNPMAHRREMMQSALALTLERPFGGYGLGTFTTVYPSQARFDAGTFVNHAHNEWLQWSTEGGLPLALAMLALTGHTIFRLRHTPWAIGLAAVALHALVDYPFVRFGLAVWIVTIAAAGTQRE